MATHCALSALLVRALWLGEADATPAPPRGAKKALANGKAAPPPPEDKAPPRAAHARLVHFNTALTLLWACGGVVLGVMEISTPNMFSNLRQQGGSNHALYLPTALLQVRLRPSSSSVPRPSSTRSSSHLLVTRPPPTHPRCRAAPQQWRYAGHGVGDDPFGGGIVRVEHSTSAHLNARYPADETRSPLVTKVAVPCWPTSGCPAGP